MWKYSLRIVGNLIGKIYWNFYDDDVITVTSLALRMESVSAEVCLAVFCKLQLASVEHRELREK